MQTALRRASRLTEKLMQLARAEGGRLLAEAPVEIGAIRMVVSEFDGQAETAGRIDLTLPDAPVMSWHRRRRLRHLARNLIENALKHGVERQVSPRRPSVHRRRPAGMAGRAFRERLRGLSEPFERGQALGAGRFGLGLAIARTIAAGTNGRIELQSPTSGRGIDVGLVRRCCSGW